jgi:hypothetical protein
MTIKRQGGIFGRNPTFNNLTVDGSLSGLSSLTLTGGNLIVSSGNGLDFSATSGTGTSELFDDYEEGTWTPTLVNFAGTPTVSGNYTKIGRMVYLDFSIGLDGTSDPSMYLIDNLPFSVASPYNGGGYLAYNNGGTTDVVINVDSAGYIRLRNSSSAMLTYNSVGASSTIIINVQYRAV